MKQFLLALICLVLVFNSINCVSRRRHHSKHKQVPTMEAAAFHVVNPQYDNPQTFVNSAHPEQAKGHTERTVRTIFPDGSYEEKHNFYNRDSAGMVNARSQTEVEHERDATVPVRVYKQNGERLVAPMMEEFPEDTEELMMEEEFDEKKKAKKARKAKKSKKAKKAKKAKKHARRN